MTGSKCSSNHLGLWDSPSSKACSVLEFIVTPLLVSDKLGLKPLLRIRFVGCWWSADRGLHLPVRLCGCLPSEGVSESVSVSQPLTVKCTRALGKKHTRARDLTHTLLHVQRSTQRKKELVFGCGEITEAEKAMCLRWQVHSGVSSVPFARLENNITGFSSV